MLKKTANLRLTRLRMRTKNVGQRVAGQVLLQLAVQDIGQPTYIEPQKAEHGVPVHAQLAHRPFLRRGTQMLRRNARRVPGVTPAHHWSCLQAPADARCDTPAVTMVLLPAVDKQFGSERTVGLRRSVSPGPVRFATPPGSAPGRRSRLSHRDMSL
jgi:hypothetical protein